MVPIFIVDGTHIVHRACHAVRIFRPFNADERARGVIAASTGNHGQSVAYAARLFGVQAAASPAAYESWKQSRLVDAPNRTLAEGLATGHPFELPQAILRQRLADFLLVSEEEILQAVVWLIERAHTLAEGAGAASLAAAYRLRSELQGKKVGIVCSGGNVSLEQLKRALALS